MGPLDRSSHACEYRKSAFGNATSVVDAFGTARSWRNSFMPTFAACTSRVTSVTTSGYANTYTSAARRFSSSFTAGAAGLGGSGAGAGAAAGVVAADLEGASCWLQAANAKAHIRAATLAAGRRGFTRDLLRRRGASRPFAPLASRRTGDGSWGVGEPRSSAQRVSTVTGGARPRAAIVAVMQAIIEV